MTAQPSAAGGRAASDVAPFDEQRAEIPMEYVPFGDTPTTRCHFYRLVCDLPAVIDPPELARIVIRAEHVAALMMPTPLGQAVRAKLVQQHQEYGPILSHPRSNRWTFLIRPDLPDDLDLYAELYRVNVSVVRAGSLIALPSPADRCTEFRVWVEPPRDTFRPSGLAVVAAVKSCAGIDRPRVVGHG